MPCDRKLGPFDCCSVVHGNGLELVKLIPDGSIDAVITDPPYGINLNTNYATAHRGCRRDFPRIAGDDQPFDPSPWLGFPIVILWGANHYADKLPPMDSWLVWHKRLPNNSDSNDLSDCELAWSSVGGPARHFQHTWNGFLRDSEVGVEREHPTQKPIALMQWCIEQAGNPKMILDPYSGSGTTLVAAKKLGHHFLGFELELEYCEVARKRIAAVEAQPTLFAPSAEQMSF